MDSQVAKRNSAGALANINLRADSGKGAEFEAGKLTLEDLHETAKSVGETAQISGKQELLEQMINWYI